MRRIGAAGQQSLRSIKRILTGNHATSSGAGTDFECQSETQRERPGEQFRAGIDRPRDPKGISKGITAENTKRYHEKTPRKSLTCKGL